MVESLRHALIARIAGTPSEKLKATLTPILVKKNSFSEYDDELIVETAVSN